MKVPEVVFVYSVIVQMKTPPSRWDSMLPGGRSPAGVAMSWVVASVSPVSASAASCVPFSREVTLSFLILLSFYFGFIHSNRQNDFHRGYLCRSYSVNYFWKCFDHTIKIIACENNDHLQSKSPKSMIFFHCHLIYLYYVYNIST